MRTNVSTQKNINIENMLRQYGVLPTQQRLAIAGVLFAQHQHVTADQLHSRLHRSGSRVAKATVYNTLGLFVTQGLVKEIFIDPNHVYYDSNNSQHHHFYNVDTGEITDIHENLEHRFDTVDLPEGTGFEEVDIVIRVRNTV